MRLSAADAGEAQSRYKGRSEHQPPNPQAHTSPEPSPTPRSLSPRPRISYLRTPSAKANRACSDRSLTWCQRPRSEKRRGVLMRVLKGVRSFCDRRGFTLIELLV